MEKELLGQLKSNSQQAIKQPSFKVPHADSIANRCVNKPGQFRDNLCRIAVA
jgi:hypothetical protein